MRIARRLARVLVISGALLLSTLVAARYGAGSLWRGFEPALAVPGTEPRTPYDLTRLEAVNETLKMIRDKYVDPDRVDPQRMLLSALNSIQRDVAEVIVFSEAEGTITVRVDTQQETFRIDNVQGPWDVSARLRQIFAFMQKHLKDTDVELREIEYAACNGMLSTLDPHSVFLSPDAYKEMNVQTSGAFGGLGIVISIRDQVLTVMNPMPDTPAGKAGLKRFDRILKIDNESTLNMPLDAAVQRLRGEPGTKVTIWVQRDGSDGWDGLKPFELEREQIKVSSVEYKALDGGVGYVELKAFQATTVDELMDALDTLRQNGPIKGLVLDLRGNPGGLLDQAARVSDVFIDDGVIVSTVGSSEGREEKRAHGNGTEPPYPLAVLVDGSSASASEIVAGALKNQDRAIIVGSQTFGKGSVQLVFPEVTKDQAALKLTIAQYMTPGDVSIQGVGITPDIELDPMTVDALEMDVHLQREGPRERDLSASLSSDRAASPSKPQYVVRYQFSQQEREAERERGEFGDEGFRMDFPVRFARDLVSRVPQGESRELQLEEASSFIALTQDAEIDKVAGELEQIGIDWSAAPIGSDKPSTSDLEVSIETSRDNDTVTAGEPMELRVTVKNNAEVPIYRLRAETDSDNGYFDDKELLFGRIGPGESVTAKAPLGWCEIEGRRPGSTEPIAEDAPRVCKVPMDALSRSDGVSVRFYSERGVVPSPVEIRPTIVALDRPLFKYSYQIADDRGGNGDGVMQRGEKLSMYLTVKNEGKGRSFDTQANLTNQSGDGVLLVNGRFDISNMMPGDVRKVHFTLNVSPELRDNEAVLTLTVGDRDLREFASEKVKVPVRAAKALADASGKVQPSADSAIRAAPSVDSEAFGTVSEGQVFERMATSGAFTKVRLEDDRFGFVESTVLSDANGTVAPDFEPAYSHAPPELVVEAATMATKADTVTIRGEASDAERLLDMYVFVGSRKVHYQSNRNGADPQRLAFEVEVPLRPGVNIINVVAREDPDSTTRRAVVVRRDAGDGTILKSPKKDDVVSEWLGE